MPTIAVAYKTPSGEVYVATDTQLTEPNARKVHLQHPKMIVTDHLAVAYTGLLRAKDILQEVVGRIKIADDGEIDEQAAADLIYEETALRKLLILNPPKTEEPPVQCPFECLICTIGHIYVLFDDFSVMEIHDNFWALGSGSSYALGAWYALQEIGENSKLSAQEILKYTLGAATKYDSFCSGNFGGVIVGKTVSEYVAI